MKNPKHLYIHITHTDCSVTVSDGAEETHTLTTGVLPEGAFQDDMTALHTMVSEALTRVKVSVQSATVMFPDRYLYAFAELLHTKGQNEETARTRIARMIPVPIDDVIWTETTLILSKPVVTYSIILRSLAEGIAHAVREKTGVRTTQYVSALTGLWNTLEQPPSTTLMVTHDAHSIDVGLFEPGVVNPLMTISVPTAEGEQSPETSIAHILTSAMRFAHEHYDVAPKHIVCHSATILLKNIESASTRLGCALTEWTPRTPHSSDTRPNTWETVCELLAASQTELMPGITLRPTTAQENATALRGRIITLTQGIMSWVYDRTQVFTRQGRQRSTYAIVVLIVCIVALGVLLWTLTTFL